MASIGTTLIVGPILSAVALAADPVVVRPGDTLTSIARRHGVTITDLVTWNRLADPNRIYAGQRLAVEPAPAPTAPPAAPAVPAPAPVAAPTVPKATTVHTVARGESLWTIARRYGVSVSALAAHNGIANPSRIYAGQRLSIPGTVPVPAPPTPGPITAPMPASMARLVAQRDAVRVVIVEEAARFGVPASLALAVAWQESGWQQGVVSSAGAIGVMQLLPATADWVAGAMLGAPVDPHDLRQNVRAGVRLLAHYLDRYDGDRDLVLAAYYQGQRAADRHGVYPVSRPYIASIRMLEAVFGG
ncbi:MAG TPA: LysM peptidoglycan-binding domain-containing protein [Candidatus Limnocylindria bacterium]|nr:LysM peptidoglycan-binding domain-containing protein [Candidatus Limnocylindria bacterium]